MSENQKNQKRDVYAIITDRIIKQLEQGIVPWKKPWTEAGLPKNLVTQRPYRGINVWLLSMLGFPHNLFITSKQLKELGGVAKDGEKANPVTFWNWKEVADEDSGEVKNVPFLRYYQVFNIQQCEGLSDEYIGEPVEKVDNPVKLFEKTILEMPQKPDIKHKEKKAFYNPLLDVVNVPKAETFKNAESYSEMFFHQLIHSTGHLTRLNRKEILQMVEFGGDQFSAEELIAEMGSCFLKSTCGFTGEGIKEDAEAAKGWLDKFKEDKQLVIYASSKAQYAAEFILDLLNKGKAPEAVAASAENDDLPF